MAGHMHDSKLSVTEADHVPYEQKPKYEENRIVKHDLQKCH